MPFIRYDTGDIGSIVEVKSRGRIKKAISNYGGRKTDMVFDSYGHLLSPHSISNNLWKFSEINQFQFIQKAPTEYKLKISIKNKFSSEKEIREIMLNLLGSKANITIEEVNEIPILESGKRKSIVNLM